MKVRLWAAAILAALALAAVGCSSSSSSGIADPGDIAACKAAMRQQFQDSIAAGYTATPGTLPVECAGIDDKTLEQLVGDLMAEEVPKAVESALTDAMESAFPEPSETDDGITPECRAWIEDELTDDSSTLDATRGEQACGYMTEDELNAAIDSITEELSAQP